MKEITRDTVLGVVFFGAMAILAYFTIVLTDFSFTEKPKLHVRFTAAQGLKVGDPVLILGTRCGRVTEVTFDSQAQRNERVVTTLTLDKAIVLKQGFQIRIEESSFLGGRMITIDPGAPNNSPVDLSTEIIGNVADSPLAELGKLVSENREDVRKIINNFRKVSDGIENGEGMIGKLLKDDTLYNNVSKTFANATQITDDLRAGKGALGRLIVDETLSTNMSTTMTNLSELSKGLRDGKGTLGKLLTEDTLYDNFNTIVADVKAGKGTLGKLIYDEVFAADLAESAKNLREISNDIAHGDGSLSRLIHDKALYDNLNSTASDLKSMLADIREGKGTLGLLVKDDTLYRDIQTTFRSINRTIEDGREAAPIATFAGLLFVAF